MTENGYDQSFTYDAAYNRVMTTISNGGNLELQRLYIDDYEVTTDYSTGEERVIHYLYGGDGLFGIAEINPNSVNAFPYNINYHYLYKDHLGSIVTATNMAQNVIEEEQNFDAWGRERNPQTWQYAGATAVGLSSNYQWLYRGYTGHEHMPHFSMVNMNGRMYDPLLGRMMSPDPYIMPAGTQGYNRYTYALNNPLKYTDPDGEWVHIVIGAVVGGAINLGMKAYQGKINSFGDGLVAFGIGAAAGAIGAATGGVAFSLAGGAAGGVGGFTAGAVAGAVGSGFSSPIQSVGNAVYFGDPIITPKEWATGVGIGALAGGTVNGSIALINGRSFWTGSPKPVPVTPMQQLPLKELPKSGGDKVEPIKLESSTRQDFFDGTKYTDKVLRQMQENNGNNFHNFPESVKAFQSDGITKPITGGDRVIRESLLIEGTYKGKQGWFEFIKEADGSINHRFFETRPENWIIDK